MRRYAAILLLLAGCDLYFGGDDQPPCANWETGGGAVAPNQLRNPDTGLCESTGGGGGCYAYDDVNGCTPCAYDLASPPSQDWGSCYSKCEGLDEQSCLGASGCIAAYDENTDYADAPSISTFKGCWATAPSGPIQGGGCWELDAQQCSRHDDCSMYYGYGDGIPPNALVAPTFNRCGPEPTTQGCSAVDCGPGSHCEDQCYPCDGKTGPCAPQCSPVCVPDEPSCNLIDCAPGYTCIETCTGMDPTSGGDGGAIPPSQCYAQCVPDGGGGGDPGSCTGFVACDALPPACPVNTTPGLLNGCWTGYCIPNSACGPNDPGSCDGQVSCLTGQPACPAGTVAGILNGCWSGYCIPQNDCPVTACEALTSESSCLARSECTPVYGGTNCTCSPNGGCTCEDLTYERCETGWL